ncbi:MAG: hypothetical protein OQJ99_06605 [Rhodospirillales bacterium]|nr:hypothetical protein [Rhodospirillales bacterium]MCW8862218.1 hypothetical protein [Rhodospirillales bacterium]MCW8951193.1 hypothetical protein [Rhodospirillales bacterium]MCW8971107.1 hypothetical protein [Rhodospirillales bacterium]MCW9001868.1 hypothetical protein [Rhodospirillales bacterium]
MRKVVYFKAGVVADFEFADEQYEEFASQMTERPSQNDAPLLEQSRGMLERRVSDNDQSPMTDQDLGAACFIWFYFNENSDPNARFEGDIVVVDEAGDGRNIQYAPTSQVRLSSVN